MPEGPEIQYLQTLLQNAISEAPLREIKIVRGRYRRHGPPKGYDSFVKELPLKCLRIEKKGKVLFFYFEKGWVMISKLGMTGWWNLYGVSHFRRHVSERNVVFEFAKDSKPSICWVYSDPRNFGTLEFTQDKEKIARERNTLGLDVMDAATTWKLFYARIDEWIRSHSKTCSIEEMLTDQKQVVCGIGNYLKSELLYEVKIAPMRDIRNISVEEWKSLFRKMKSKTRKMYQILLRGEEKTYENSMMVYGRKKDPMGRKVETYTDPRGRTTHWVPSVQK